MSIRTWLDSRAWLVLHRFLPCLAVAVLPAISIVIASSTQAQWQPTGAPICTALDAQQYPSMIASNGAIVAWVDWRYQTEPHIFAQHVDTTGVMSWTVGGVPVCVQSGSQGSPVVASDAFGGAFVFWLDDRIQGESVFAQVIDSNGNALLTTNGVPVATVKAARGDLVAITDGNPGLMQSNPPGAIAAWREARPNVAGDIYMAHVRRDGSMPWTAGGVPLCTAAGDQYSPSMATDGAFNLTGIKGAIVAWTDLRSDSLGDIYAGHVTATGTTPWTPNGVVVCNAAGVQGDPHVAFVGGGQAIVAWSDGRTPNPGIYAQKLDSNGNALWAANGVPVRVAPSSGSPRLVSDGAGGAFIAWMEQRAGDFDLYAQRLDANGNLLWPAAGVPVCTAVGSQAIREVLSDNAGGMIVGWDDYRVSSAPHAFARRLDANGNPVWPLDGLAACSNGAAETFSVMVNDPESGAIVVWMDARPGGADTDLYGNRIFSSGGITAVPSPSPSRFGVSLVSANPVRGAARIRVEVPRAGTVIADVLDPTGRRVRRLELGAPSQAGSFELEWDGRRDDGAAARAGLYFVRVQEGTESAGLKLVEMR